jgi:hypothetical protein
MRRQSPSGAETAYLALSGIFLGALVVTNVIAGKLFVLFGAPLSCGIIAYPATFLATDLVSEIYGRERATPLVKVGFLVSVFVTAVVVIATLAPPHEHTIVDQASFRTVFGVTPGIVFGSMCAYLAAQLVDVHLFEFWRNLTQGKHLWLRNNASTLFSQLVDTILVVVILLAVWPRIDGNPETAALGWGPIVQMIVGQYFFKAAVALLDTPLFYAGVALLRRWIDDAPSPVSASPEGAATLPDRLAR